VYREHKRVGERRREGGKEGRREGGRKEREWWSSRSKTGCQLVIYNVTSWQD